MAAKELGRLTRTIDKINDCKVRCVEVGVPGCRYQLDRALVELERGRECLSAKAPNNDVYAALTVKLRLEALTHSNVRDINRAKNAKAKRVKTRAAVKKALGEKETRHYFAFQA